MRRTRASHGGRGGAHASRTRANGRDDGRDVPLCTGVPREGRGSHVSRDALVGRFQQLRQAEASEGGEAVVSGGNGEEGRAGGSGVKGGVLVVTCKPLAWRTGGGEAAEEGALQIMARELGVRDSVATRRGLIEEIEAYLGDEGYKDLRYETAQESWEIFAREMLCRFEVFWRFSYGLQQYTRAKKRTAVYRTRMEQLLAERDARIAALEAELARMQAAAADGDEER